MTVNPPKTRRARIPSGRIERLARIGWLAGEVTLGGLAEGARRWFGSDTVERSIFVTHMNAQRLAKRLSSLRGAAMKLGQLLSLEGDDYLPPEITGALARLRADAHAMPDAQLRRVLGHALGKGWERRFREFGFDPVAAASIGQVHYAVANDGRELALKIQYPGVARSIDSDVDNLASLLRLSRLLPGAFDVSGLLTEAKRQLRQEADYHAEAAHLRRYRGLLADDPAFVVPGVHDDFTTPHVLAMDFVRGTPLDEVGEISQAVRNRIGVHSVPPAVPRVVRVPIRADGPELRQLFLAAERGAGGAARPGGRPRGAGALVGALRRPVPRRRSPRIASGSLRRSRRSVSWQPTIAATTSRAWSISF